MLDTSTDIDSTTTQFVRLILVVALDTFESHWLISSRLVSYLEKTNFDELRILGVRELSAM